MDIQTARNALLWCTIINYAVLMVWFVVHLLPHTWLHRLWSRWFHLTSEQFDAINFAGIGLYKLGIRPVQSRAVSRPHDRSVRVHHPGHVRSHQSPQAQ